MRRAIPVAIASLVCACRGAVPPTRGGNPDLHVEGNQLWYQGKPTRLLGVSHSGSEYLCARDGARGVFEGPDPDALAASLLAWGHVNTVRLPLNEDCWLGINGVSAATSGPAYRAAIVQYASRLHAHGLFTVVDLHWSSPGSHPALGQQPMPDADHAPTFWASVAGAFEGDPMTVFDLFNEPFVTPSNASTSDPWACWADGCTVTVSTGEVAGSWRAAGMRELVAAVRGVGARNVIMLGGLGYANDLTGWLAHVPIDPLGQLAASFHLYNFNPCADATCWDAQIAPVAVRVPVITGELGENDCAHGLLDAYLPWADAHHVSYLGWSWNAWDCAKGPALISGYEGTATAFGQGLRDHLATTAP
jgi:endoglucanase